MIMGIASIGILTFANGGLHIVEAMEESDHIVFFKANEA